jgi:hypothetical protein
MGIPARRDCNTWYLSKINSFRKTAGLFQTDSSADLVNLKSSKVPVIKFQLLPLNQVGSVRTEMALAPPFA